MEKLLPLGDKVIIKPIEKEEVTRGGIILPDTAKEKPQEGEVIAAGPGRVTRDGNKIPLEVNVGDRVLFGKYSGSEIKFNDEKYLIMPESDILAVIVQESHSQAKGK